MCLSRQRKPCNSSAVIVVRQRNVAAMRLDDRRADRQPETKAVGLGRVERLEQPALLHGMDAGSAILHQYFDGSGSASRAWRPSEPLRDGRRRHRIHRVHDEVEQDLLQLDRVTQGCGQVARQIKLDVDPRG